MNHPLPPPGQLNFKHVAILGATGSIGTAALDVMSALSAVDPEWKVIALSTHSRLDLLARQVEQFRPTYAVVTGPEPSADFRQRIRATGTELLLGQQGLRHVAGAPDSGTVLAAIVGAAGLPAVVEAVAKGKRLALANKESLVVAGSVVMPLARKTGSLILPVDSEHSAIFQALAAGRRQDVRKVILTASGGPFRNTPADQMHNPTVAQALNHPTWKMGGKITIDSATLFNKAFELIEARWLFDLTADEIEVVVHPQSIIHSMVEFVDGSTLAQLSPPDMKLPIQYALTWPERHPCPGAGGTGMNWTHPHTLTFEPPDRAKFPAIDIAYQVARTGGTPSGTLGAVVNAANEVAVESFLAGRSRFGSITQTVQKVLSRHTPTPGDTLESLLQADTWARQEAQSLLPH